ncbi:ABC transporter ATP-binding protein [Anaerofilum sp. BX8]|uniref:ABC transporter ATP-binding protein n=1 Tax=Anaerofilum hominis TaxID=2763016 RepID=A0A923IDZ9_9FIRM|nr:ABC transporter ATP-binding protein [Anaerofilum hominis]MBC5581460.1 ABC transporter ATP-binding protein [Anaerofilum hominis]
MQNKNTPAVETRALCKAYHTGDAALPVLREVALTIPAGSFAAITGPSGSGKSTLLSVLGCLDTADSGSLRLFGQEVAGADEKVLSALRGGTLGFVFQSFNLLPGRTALENVELPLRYRRLPAARRRALAAQALEAVGLSDRAAHLPGQLSGGQQQRVAIARALAMRPRLLLADEPTGSLDSASAAGVLECMEQLLALGTTVVLVTHDLALAARAPLRFEMRDGVLSPVN